MSDLIDRQAAIDALEKVADLFPWRVPGNRDSYDRYNEAWNDAIGRAEMEIEKLPSVQSEQRWIPVSERLPEEDGQYLITVKYKHVDGYNDIYAEHGEWDDEKWDMFCFGHCGEVEDILAWMPLPEPYRGE